MLPDLLSEFPLKKLGWLEILLSQPVVAIPIKLAPVIRTVIRSRIIPVRIIVTVRVISVIARTESDTEVNLSIRTCRPREHQTPSHDCN